MNPIKNKLRSFLTEAAHKGVKALDPQSPCAKQLSEIEDIDTVIDESVEKICQAATMSEITKMFFLATRLKGASGQEREAVKSDIENAAEVLLARVEAESGPLNVPQSCRRILFGYLLELTD